LSLPLESNIKNWTHGFDGIIYVIEHSDKKTYWIKNYWSPSSQRSIPEAIIVLDLVKNLSNKLSLQELYSSFKTTLPKRGCYNSGGLATMCYISNSFEFGYSGATKLPNGFYSSYVATNIGNVKVNGAAVVQYNFNNNGFHHLNIQTSKWKVFYRNSNLSDFIVYNYQNRVLDIDGSKNKFENHQIKYGLNLTNKVSIGVGLDHVSRKLNKYGGLFSASRWFSNESLNTTLTTSIFNNQVNYKAEILKSFNFSSNFPIHSVSIGIAYEDFMDYKDLYFGVSVLL
jgi:hypothetical protein